LFLCGRIDRLNLQFQLLLVGGQHQITQVQHLVVQRHAGVARHEATGSVPRGLHLFSRHLLPREGPTRTTRCQAKCSRVVLAIDFLTILEKYAKIGHTYSA